MNQDYSIKTVKNLLNEIEERKGIYLYQDEFNRSMIYELPDKQIILLPTIGIKGIVFKNIELMKENTKFGVPLIEEHPNPFQKDIDKLSDLEKLEKHIPYYLQYLSEELNIELDIVNESPEYFSLLSNKINKYGCQKAYDNLFIPIGIFIGEKLRKRNMGTWILYKRYAYNPYFEPQIAKGSNVSHPWYGLAKMLLNKRRINFCEYYEFALKMI